MSPSVFLSLLLHLLIADEEYDSLLFLFFFQFDNIFYVLVSFCLRFPLWKMPKEKQRSCTFLLLETGVSFLSKSFFFLILKLLASWFFLFFGIEFSMLGLLQSEYLQKLKRFGIYSIFMPLFGNWGRFTFSSMNPWWKEQACWPHCKRNICL